MNTNISSTTLGSYVTAGTIFLSPRGSFAIHRLTFFRFFRSSTILLPPIPCGVSIHCLHPCARYGTCGHPPTPHACHEEPDCPPCPFLTEKQCACGKKKIGNVRCSQDAKKVNCGLVCGK